jgi:DNA-binding NarL/FixJ family response regulator
LDPTRPFTVVLADDQRAFREGLARAIARHGRLRLVAVAGSGDEAFDVIEALQPDLGLIDVRMAGLSGPAVCGLLRERHPEIDTRLVLMSVDGSEFDEVRTMVDGFVGKDRSRREICDTLVQVGERTARRIRLLA